MDGRMSSAEESSEADMVGRSTRFVWGRKGKRRESGPDGGQTRAKCAEGRTSPML